MATYENKGRMTYKDGNGNLHILYPMTQIDCVEGLEERLNSQNVNIDGETLVFADNSSATIENETLIL